MDGLGSWEARRNDRAANAAEGLVEHLDRFAPARRGPPLSAPKRIAALALYVRTAYALETDAALRLAMNCLEERLNTTRGALRKVSSEARAILEFGLADFAASPDGTALQTLREIVSALHRLNMRAVTQARAAAYGGLRGGRRPGPQPRRAQAAVSGLIARAAAGDAAALAELAEVAALIRDADAAPACA
ncbi:MAG: hypothetical protein GC203_04310 [Phenylobacterium sp.]|uniref:hypothetical protein n=1 Tax=Phenylobacterium sp. TaxID=1871053 RepID=UPI0025CF1BBD|nr:hypothetical protein [Phenylobacterium sp.]MBI1197066.1 hypothetical protein [Phenylobacterium sp.]